VRGADYRWNNKPVIDSKGFPETIKKALDQITDHLENGIIPIWLNRGIDAEYGGYLNCFDPEGNPTEDTDKYIVTQTRMIWGMSSFYRKYSENKRLLDTAKQGVQFFIKYFWDHKNGG
jgi:cellobiose epimerase